MTTISIIAYAIVVLLAYRAGRRDSKLDMDKIQADNMQLAGEVWRLTTKLNNIEKPENTQ